MRRTGHGCVAGFGVAARCRETDFGRGRRRAQPWGAARSVRVPGLPAGSGFRMLAGWTDARIDRKRLAVPSLDPLRAR